VCDRKKKYKAIINYEYFYFEHNVMNNNYYTNNFHTSRNLRVFFYIFPTKFNNSLVLFNHNNPWQWGQNNSVEWEKFKETYVGGLKNKVAKSTFFFPALNLDFSGIMLITFKFKHYNTHSSMMFSTQKHIKEKTYSYDLTQPTLEDENERFGTHTNH